MRRELARSVTGAGELLNVSHVSMAPNPIRSYHRSTSQRGCDKVLLEESSAAARSARSAGLGGSGSYFRWREIVRSTALTKPAALDLPARRVKLSSSSTTAEAG